MRSRPGPAFETIFKQLCPIRKPAHLVAEADGPSQDRVWPVIASYVELALGVIEGEADTAHAFHCFLDIPCIRDARIGCLRDGTVLSVVTASDFEAIKQFADGAFPAIKGTDLYAKITHLFGAILLYKEVTSAPKWAKLLPPRFVDALRQEGSLVRLDSFTPVRNGYDMIEGED